MNKKEAIKIILCAAQIYDKYFNDKNLLLVYGSEINPSCIQIKALGSNFLHLTGLKTNRNVSAEKFYQKAINKKLAASDFTFKDNTTVEKLNVLQQVLNISQNARMLGNYNDYGFNLQTEKIAGGVKCCLGFVRTGKYYVPNTVLKGDIRDRVVSPQRILCIMSKRTDEIFYNQVLYTAKNVDFSKALFQVSNYVPVIVFDNSNEMDNYITQQDLERYKAMWQKPLEPKKTEEIKCVFEENQGNGRGR